MNILFIMNVDWNWIKQRPHFIAEGLSDRFNVKMEAILKLKNKRVYVMSNPKNLGIAVALNRLMAYGANRNFSWMLSFDQDSVCGQEFVSSMSRFLFVTPNIGVVAPIIHERNVGIVDHKPNKEYAGVKTCITSGSIANIIYNNKKNKKYPIMSGWKSGLNSKGKSTNFINRGIPKW